MTSRLSVLPVLAVLVTASAGFAQCQYEVTFVNAPDCGTTNTAELLWGVNDQGVLVGTYGDCSFANKPMMWSPATGVVTLPMPPDAFSGAAHGVAPDGTVVGTILMNSGPLQFLPAIWTDGVLTTVPLPLAATEGWALGIDDSGSIGGYWFKDSLGPYPFLFSGGVFHDLGPELPKPWNVAHFKGMSKNGIIAGQMFAGDPLLSRGFVRTSKGVSVVHPTGEGWVTDAHAVNSTGQAVGRMRVPFPRAPGAYLWHPIIWSDGVTIELPLPVDMNQGHAIDINTYGQIVGQVGKKNPSNGSAIVRAAIWIDGQPFLVKDLVGTIPGMGLISDARAINDLGEIAVTTNFNNSAAAAILRPIRTRASDLVVDCKINAYDLSALLSVWGNMYGDSEGFGDINGDGVVGASDLGMLLGDWDPAN